MFILPAQNSGNSNEVEAIRTLTIRVEAASHTAVTGGVLLVILTQDKERHYNK